MIKNPSVVTIVTDGWTGINGLSVINYVAVAGKKTYFLESVHTGCQSHDAEFLVQDIKRVVNKYDFLHVGAVVTGNTETNKAGWAQLQPDFPRGFFFHGCACHALHLLVKDTVAHLKWLDELQASCKVIVSFFKTICKPLKRFEKNNTPVSEVYQLFLDFPDAVAQCGLPTKDVKVVKKLITERFDFVYGDVHGVGHILDPHYCGARMDMDTDRMWSRSSRSGMEVTKTQVKSQLTPL
ncbi:hypothetical protein JG688_00009935 [Phytophthora aleatoria]|uniref:DUF659 domain-containing protein n=1 Tax=Phytophthora aleatoria TaxID=2496075 RepID=A0A8J5INA4_9STRA|nr:hypothetical protein JG688_00009935 [Phytophthora aleatoria]